MKKLVLLLALTSLVSCGKKEIIKEVNTGNAEQLETQGERDKAAEEFAIIGEILLQTDNFPLADKMFDRSLKSNPQNAKANFYSAFTKPLSKFKGFGVRFDKILHKLDFKNLQDIRKDAQRSAVLNSFVSELNPEAKAFSNDYEVQNFLKTEIMPELNNSVEKLAKVKGKELTLFIDFKKLDSSKSSSHNCTHSLDKERLQVSCTKSVNENSFMTPSYNVDDSDLLTVSSSMMALVDSIKLSTAYKLKGVKAFYRELKDLSTAKRKENKFATAKEITDLLKQEKYKELFTLEEDNKLQELNASLDTVLKNGLYLNSLSNERCHNPERRSNLIHSLCMSSLVIRKMGQASELLAGPTDIKLGLDSDKKPIMITVNVATFLNASFTDLKEQLPENFDERGHTVDLPDATVGGLFPNGDLVEALKKIVKE